jgi:hypothetical protein
MENLEQELAKAELSEVGFFGDSFYRTYITPERLVVIHKIPERLISTKDGTNRSQSELMTGEPNDIEPNSIIIKQEPKITKKGIVFTIEEWNTQLTMPGQSVIKIREWKQIAQKPKMDRLLALNGKKSFQVTNKNVKQILLDEGKNKLQIKTDIKTKTYNLILKNQIHEFKEALQKVYGEKFTYKN